MALSSFKRIMKIYTFPKSEHLCSQKDIEALFTAGSRSSVMYPLRAVWRLVDYDKGPKAGAVNDRAFCMFFHTGAG